VGPQPVVLGPVPRPRRIDIVRMREPAERNRMRRKPPSAQGRLPIGWLGPRLQLQSPLQELAASTGVAPPWSGGSFGGGQSRRNGSPPPRCRSHPLWRTPAGRRNLSHTLARNPSAPVGLSFEGGRLSRENRAGDCGDTNASRARANPRSRPYAFSSAALFGFRGSPPGRACSYARARQDFSLRRRGTGVGSREHNPIGPGTRTRRGSARWQRMDRHVTRRTA
jgi:hypothetical protein